MFGGLLITDTLAAESEPAVTELVIFGVTRSPLRPLGPFIRRDHPWTLAAGWVAADCTLVS